MRILTLALSLLLASALATSGQAQMMHRGQPGFQHPVFHNNGFRHDGFRRDGFRHDGFFFRDRFRHDRFAFFFGFPGPFYAPAYYYPPYYCGPPYYPPCPYPYAPYGSSGRGSALRRGQRKAREVRAQVHAGFRFHSAPIKADRQAAQGALAVLSVCPEAVVKGGEQAQDVRRTASYRLAINRTRLTPTNTASRTATTKTLDMLSRSPSPRGGLPFREA